MRTQPNANQLEQIAHIDPETRQWIERYIREQIAAIPQPKPPAQTACQRCNAVDRLEDRVAELERRYAQDDKYSLTRAKLVMFMKNAGIK
jgi:ubiquinone biosynthesis protein UbiJ